MNAISTPNLINDPPAASRDSAINYNPSGLDQMTILAPVIQELIRRSVDGTVVPLFVDYTNSRVIIGGIAASASPAKCEIATGDIKVVSGGSGIILASRDGTKFGRLVLENADANGNLQLSVDPL